MGKMGHCSNLRDETDVMRGGLRLPGASAGGALTSVWLINNYIMAIDEKIV